MAERERRKDSRVERGGGWMQWTRKMAQEAEWKGNKRFQRDGKIRARAGED